jgi:hypothetical protein
MRFVRCSHPVHISSLGLMNIAILTPIFFIRYCTGHESIQAVRLRLGALLVALCNGSALRGKS